jgi:molybdate transport system substrate-binding protein
MPDRRDFLAAMFGVFGSARAALGADELRVMTNGAFAAAQLDLAPRFERATGHRIVTAATTTGFGADAIPNRVLRGEPVDVVFLPDELMQQLIDQGAVVRESRRVVAGARVGVAVRAGIPRPDINSVPALKKALLEAKSVAFSAGTSGIYLSTELFPRLGVAEEIKGKSKRIQGEPVGAVLARGEADLGFQQISELLPIKGIQYLGPLPSEVQRITPVIAGITSRSSRPDLARQFIDFIMSPAAASTLKQWHLQRPRSE